MVFTHAMLSEAELGPAVSKVVSDSAPPQMRMMAARGLAPLQPRDLLVALYQLWVQGDGKLSEDAARTLEQLPAKILQGALADSALFPGVLDFIARKMAKKDDVLELVLRHPQVDDHTLVAVARVCTERTSELLAQNEQRWLRCPKIAESLYQNPNCKMSTAHRMIELAVRQGVDLDLPNMEEIKHALGDGVPVDPARDEIFREAAGASVAEEHEKLVEQLATAQPSEVLVFGPSVASSSSDEPATMDDAAMDLEATLALSASDDLDLPVQEGPMSFEDEGGNGHVAISQLRPMEKVRLALLGNTFERAMLIRDSNKSVCMSAIKSPRVKENEVVAYAANRALSPDVIRYIARKREWTKLYSIKLNLVLNPKTPMPAALGFLAHLHAHDVRKIANSKNIPSALATAAKRKLAQRS